MAYLMEKTPPSAMQPLLGLFPFLVAQIGNPWVPGTLEQAALTGALALTAKTPDANNRGDMLLNILHRILFAAQMTSPRHRANPSPAARGHPTGHTPNPKNPSPSGPSQPTVPPLLDSFLVRAAPLLTSVGNMHAAADACLSCTLSPAMHMEPHGGPDLALGEGSWMAAAVEAVQNVFGVELQGVVADRETTPWWPDWRTLLLPEETLRYGMRPFTRRTCQSSRILGLANL